eukprot:1061205-Rhodomonas_salina.2
MKAAAIMIKVMRDNISPVQTAREDVTALVFRATSSAERYLGRTVKSPLASTVSTQKLHCTGALWYSFLYSNSGDGIPDRNTDPATRSTTGTKDS